MQVSVLNFLISFQKGFYPFNLHVNVFNALCKALGIALVYEMCYTNSPLRSKEVGKKAYNDPEKLVVLCSRLHCECKSFTSPPKCIHSTVSTDH